MFKDRVELYSNLQEIRKSKVLAYITGDRQGLETQIHSEVYDFFVHHLDLLGVVPKISFFLYTRGGDTLAAWSLVNLIKQFCDEFEVIIPSKAHSSGTLICLGANKIVMTKQATLGPIDPSVNTPLNPQIPGAPPLAKFPVSVEAINGYIDLAKEHFGDKKPECLKDVFLKLSDNIHPLVLGQVFRSKSQIKMIASRLITGQVKDREKIDRIISFLVSESGSHDYAIHRREARDFLGLQIENPDEVLYDIINKLYLDIQNELKLTKRFDLNTLLGQEQHITYSEKRALLESVNGGSYYFVSSGQAFRREIQTPQGLQKAIEDQRAFEGWEFENV